MNIGNNFAFKRAENCYEGDFNNVATVEGIGKKTLLLLFVTLITSLFMIVSFVAYYNSYLYFLILHLCLILMI